MKNTIHISLLFTLIGNVVATSKRGLVIVNAPHEQTDLPKYLTSPLLNWVYNYGATPSSNATYPFGNLSFVPMLWGQDNSATFLSTVEAEQNYSYVLTFNEPDMPKSVGGSELSVSDAVTLWDQQIQPLAEKGYKLGAPGGIPTSGDFNNSRLNSQRSSLAILLLLTMHKLHNRLSNRPFLWPCCWVRGLPNRPPRKLHPPSNLGYRIRLSRPINLRSRQLPKRFNNLPRQRNLDPAVCLFLRLQAGRRQ